MRANEVQVLVSAVVEALEGRIGNIVEQKLTQTTTTVENTDTEFVKNEFGHLVRKDHVQKKAKTTQKHTKKAKSKSQAKGINVGLIKAEIERKNDVIGYARYNGNYKRVGDVVLLGKGKGKKFVPFVLRSSGKLARDLLHDYKNGKLVARAKQE